VSSGSSCRGSTTAETAVVLPVLVVVLLMAVWVLACVLAQLRCVDAARAAARAAARGDAAPAVVSAGREVAPAGADVALSRQGAHAVVVVRAQVRPFGAVLRRLPATAVSARAVADIERPAAPTPGLP